MSGNGDLRGGATDDRAQGEGRISPWRNPGSSPIALRSSPTSVREEEAEIVESQALGELLLTEDVVGEL